MTLVDEIVNGLSNQGWTSLFIDEYRGADIGDLHIDIYTATVSTQERDVFDAWVTCGGGMMHVVNQTSLEAWYDALAYHLGLLALDGNYQIVFDEDGPRYPLGEALGKM